MMRRSGVVEVELVRQSVAQVSELIQIAEEKRKRSQQNLQTKISQTDALAQTVNQLQVDKANVHQAERQAEERKNQLHQRLAAIGGEESAINVLENHLLEAKTELAQTKSDQNRLLVNRARTRERIALSIESLKESKSQDDHLQSEFWKIMDAKREMEQKIRQLEDKLLTRK